MLSASSSPLSSDTPPFHFFSRLPIELRLKIWNYNLPQTRLVPVRCGADWSCLPDSLEAGASLSTGCTSSAIIPANLHVCTESRAAALKYYQLQFGFARGPGQVFFNPVHDILYFGPRDGYMMADSQFHTCMSMCDPNELAAVRRVAINDGLFWIDSTYRSMTASRMTVELLRRLQARLPGLEEIIFVPREEESLDNLWPECVEPTMVYVRIAHQIQTALATLCEHTPDWTPPDWKILPLSAFPQP
ncbi:hypothetical protein BGZ63DRAFT_425939 [Mariannaea sp. PMI_226]|nr:hypothetical protein BGZ63DRAFT_425939 [Mariannaea sp. PMI_226]